MSRKSKRYVYPSCDKYYVYALFKPESPVPFYVGKGKNGRINNHFLPCNLKVNTPKNNVIKKYGDSIKRDILCYFDNEEKAYEFEEYLISLYGLMGEGGCLTNYAKNRKQYSKLFVENVVKKSHSTRKRMCSKQTIFKILDLYFNKFYTNKQISEETGVSPEYIGAIKNGHKYKKDYFDYINKNLISVDRDWETPVSSEICLLV